MVALDAAESMVALDAAHVAYLPDPVKLASEAGYPAPDVRERLAGEAGMAFTTLSCEDVASGRLAGHTVLVVPGGFAPHTFARLGDAGAAAIREWTRAGGGFVGVCAGAFLGCELGLLPVSVRDIDHVGAEATPCRVAFTAAGQDLLGGPSAPVIARYANGPLLQLLEQEGGSAALQVLATFASSARPAAVAMEGSPAIVAGRFGDGLVRCSPLPRGRARGIQQSVSTSTPSLAQVLLASPHLEDGPDERTRAPFRNLARLAHGFGRAARHERRLHEGPRRGLPGAAPSCAGSRRGAARGRAGSCTGGTPSADAACGSLSTGEGGSDGGGGEDGSDGGGGEGGSDGGGAEDGSDGGGGEGGSGRAGRASVSLDRLLEIRCSLCPTDAVAREL